LNHSLDGASFARLAKPALAPWFPNMGDRMFSKLVFGTGGEKEVPEGKLTRRKGRAGNSRWK